MTIAEVRLSDTSQPPTKRPRFISRPGFLERSLAFFAIAFLTVGLPNEWFVTDVDGTNASSGGPFVIVVFMALVGALLVFSLKDRGVMGNLVIAELPLVLLSLIILFSAVWSVDPNTSFRRSIAVTLTTLLGVYFVARFELDEILFTVALVMMFAVALNWVFVMGLPAYGKNFDGTQYLGATTNRNVLGQLMVLGCLSFQFLMGNRRWRFIAILFWFGAFGLVLGTRSKTSLLSLILINVLWFIFSTFRARKQLFGAVLVSEVTAGLFGFLFATANLPLITDLLDRDITLTGRTILWGDLLVPIGERFWLGHGWSAFWGGYRSPAHEIWVSHDWTPPTAHNAFLEYLLVIGFVGLCLWMLVTARGLLRSIHHLRDIPGTAGMFPILMISYMLLFSITEAGSLRRGLDWMLVVVAVVETKRFIQTKPAGFKRTINT